ncbi:MAG: DUF169 domain-containing protein [Dehalococcoidales bacterium]
MTTIKEFNRCGEELERILLLRTSPVAVKMLAKKADIPEGAVRPKKDRKYHLAQCQAFAMSRREGTTVAMLKEDHWCPAALMAYGMVPLPKKRGPVSAHPYERFEHGKYVGIVTAPLKSASFKPDVVIVYSNTTQLRSLLLSMGPEDIAEVNGRFFPPSCAHAVVTPMLQGGYWVVLPDPGEYQRALCDEGEMMFAVPAAKLPGLVVGLDKYQSRGFGYRNHNYNMLPDFPRPDFYKAMFKQWGLEDY